MNYNELINLENSDIIDVEEAIHKIKEMKRREEILKKHEKIHKISRGPDKRYRTYVTINGKNKLVAKSCMSDLEDYLVEFYEDEIRQSDVYAATFDEAFEKFCKYKADMIAENTQLKYKSDYRRFFEGTDFSKKKLEDINELDCIQFIVTRIKELHLNKRAYEALYSYMAGTLRYMWANKIICENPMDRLQRKDYFRFCTKSRQDPKKRIVSRSEREKIDAQMSIDQANDPELITPYAVQLAELTGLRIGELAALTWDCVNFEDRVITIDKAEIYHQKSAIHEIGETKTGEIRYIPMTTQMEDLLIRVRSTEEKYGFISDYVFTGKLGRITKNAIGKYIRSVCERCELPDIKTIHSFRRTLNSKLKFVGADTETAASMLGHSVDVNINHYSYDITDMDYKRGILERAQKTAM